MNCIVSPPFPSKTRIVHEWVSHSMEAHLPWITNSYNRTFAEIPFLPSSNEWTCPKYSGYCSRILRNSYSTHCASLAPFWALQFVQLELSQLSPSVLRDELGTSEFRHFTVQIIILISRSVSPCHPLSVSSNKTPQGTLSLKEWHRRDEMTVIRKVGLFSSFSLQ